MLSMYEIAQIDLKCLGTLCELAPKTRVIVMQYYDKSRTWGGYNGPWDVDIQVYLDKPLVQK